MNRSTVVRYKHDWQGQHLIIREGRPSGIALDRGGAASRPTGAELSFSASTESAHLLIDRVSKGIRAGMVSRMALSRLQ